MKFLHLAAATATALLTTATAFAAPEALHLSLPSTTGAFGQSASAAADLPLPVSFSADAGTRLTAFTWWGYHTPDSNGTDAFAIALNGSAVVGTFTAEATGNMLPDPAGGTGNAMLIRYSIDFSGLPAQAGSNELSVINSDLGAVWWWQGTGTGSDPYQPAWRLTAVTQAVPEPHAAMLLMAGLLLAGALRRRGLQSASTSDQRS